MALWLSVTVTQGAIQTSPSSGASTPIGRKNSNSSLGMIGGVPENIHPAISELALLYASHRIVGGNQRCLALLRAFKKVIADYNPPQGISVSRHLDAMLKPQIAWLVRSRPLAISMAHAIRHLKWQIAHLPQNIEIDAVKVYLVQGIDSYIRERIELADELIVSLAVSRINDNDSLLIFSHSDVIMELLVTASITKRFSLHIVDAGPLFEGQAFLKSLLSRTTSIPISYVLLSAIGHILRTGRITRVLLGAHCVYSNGNVQSRAGSSLIALMAHQANVPVVICCETYKFSDRVQLECSSLSCSIDEPIPGANARYTKALHDIIPAKFVSMIITEIGMIPCTSVPVVLREYRPFPI